MNRYLIAFALALFLSPIALADITGQPRVIDGDTLEVAGQRIRLHGIDAPVSGGLGASLGGGVGQIAVQTVSTSIQGALSTSTFRCE